MPSNIIPLHRIHADAPTPLALRPRVEPGKLYEICARRGDWAAAVAFVLAFGAVAAGPVLWVCGRVAGARLVPCAAGLAAMGFDPGRLLLVQAGDGMAMLRAGIEGARCPGLAAVVMESGGALPEYDLTASRRFLLAAERSRVPVLMLREAGQAGAGSACHIRWAVCSVASGAVADPMVGDAALLARLPGPGRIAVEVLRQRGGPAGQHWQMEWDETDGQFHDTADTADDRTGLRFGAAWGRAATSGAVAGVSAVRKGAAGSALAMRGGRGAA